VSQRQILENSIDLLKTVRGPAKLLWAASGVPMPTIIDNVINPTTGAPAASWVPFGLTRGGINIVKNLDIAVRDDVDQIFGAYDQDITDKSYQIVTQLAEIANDQTRQAAIALEMGPNATVVASAAGATQVMRFLDDNDNKTEERRWAIIFPKSTNGKVIGFVFRRGAIAGGEKTLRFDKSDPVSPALDLRFFPEIATTIAAEDQYGRIFEIE
jgi:hypothetical protein